MKIYIKSSASDMFTDVYAKRMKEVETAAKRIAKKYGLTAKVRYDDTPVSDIMGELYIEVYDGAEYVTTIIVDAYMKGWAIQSPNSGKTKTADHKGIIENMEYLFQSFA